MDPKRTLCARCVKDYRTAGFCIVPDGYQTVKDSCDICGRPGFTYVMKNNERNRPDGES